MHARPTISRDNAPIAIQQAVGRQRISTTLSLWIMAMQIIIVQIATLATQVAGLATPATINLKWKTITLKKGLQILVSGAWNAIPRGRKTDGKI